MRFVDAVEIGVLPLAFFLQFFELIQYFVPLQLFLLLARLLLSCLEV